jgi:acetyl esterase/lipase
VTVTYRTAGDGVHLPRSVDDIRCAAAFAARTTSRPGGSLRPVVLLGHSSGAHLSPVAALTGPAPPPACPGGTPSAGVRVVGLVGLAGPYAIRRFAADVAPLIGSTPVADPAAWRAADPIRLARGAPPGLRVLLLHGTADDLVPSSMSADLGDALRAAGVDVTVRMIDGADHLSLFTAAVAAGPVQQWLLDGPGPQ